MSWGYGISVCYYCYILLKLITATMIPYVSDTYCSLQDSCGLCVVSSSIQVNYHPETVDTWLQYTGKWSNSWPQEVNCLLAVYNLPSKHSPASLSVRIISTKAGGKTVSVYWSVALWRLWSSDCAVNLLESTHKGYMGQCVGSFQRDRTRFDILSGW